MRAVVLQPMYLPWMGYFGMIEQADIFVYYDDVQFVRRSWQRRNKIKVPGGDFTWLTVTVKKDFGQYINEVETKDDGWQNTHWQSIHHSYASSPYYEEYAEGFQNIYEEDWSFLVNLNIAIIEWLFQNLSLSETKFMRSSNLDVDGQKTDRLLNILSEIGADEYVSGPGAKDYIEPEKFADAGVELYWHEFSHPEYEQIHGDFVSHLSAIDLLFNQGKEASKIIKDAEKGALVPE